MTFGKFMRLYNAYRNNFDVETALRSKGILYSEIGKEPSISDVIPF